MVRKVQLRAEFVYLASRLARVTSGFFMPHPIRTTLALIALLAGAARAELSREQVAVEIARAPATAAVRTEVRVSAAERGVQLLEVTLTNTSGHELALQRMTLRLPWRRPEGDGFLVCAGGYDMGRSEARVHRPGDGAIESESFLLARRPGGFSFAGFVTWQRFTSRLAFRDGEIVVTADGEGRLLRAGETIALEKIRLAEDEDWQDALFAYADAIARENHIKLNPRRSWIGWGTWDYYGRNWTAETVTSNLDALLKIHPQATLLQIDGGWWPQRGDYFGVRESLQPDGMKKLAAAIRAKGLTAGIHLDGMRGDAKAQVAREHPDYFLRDQRGAMLVDATTNVGESLDYTFFDYSNPAARDYMRRALNGIRHDWGFDYIKIDFLRFGLNAFIQPRIERSGEPREIVPFDRALTSVERFHLGMAAFREGMGADAYFLGCSAVFGPVFGHVDGLRSGADIGPNFKHYKDCVLDNVGNFYLHGKVVYTDADYHVVRAKEDQDDTLVKAPNKNGRDLKQNEAEMWTHYVALFGGPKINSDKLPILREERRELFRTAASLPACDRFVPIDLWAHARRADDPPGVILGEAGGAVYLGVFNWDDEARVFRIGGVGANAEKALSRIAGEATVAGKDGVATVSLPARHSSLFRLPAGVTFDRLRKAMTVE